MYCEPVPPQQPCLPLPPGIPQGTPSFAPPQQFEPRPAQCIPVQQCVPNPGSPVICSSCNPSRSTSPMVCYPVKKQPSCVQVCYPACVPVCPPPTKAPKVTCAWDRTVYQACYNLITFFRLVDVNVYECVHGRVADEARCAENVTRMLEYKLRCDTTSNGGTDYDSANNNYKMLCRLMTNNYLCPTVNYLSNFISLMDSLKAVGIPEEYCCHSIDTNTNCPTPYYGDTEYLDFLNDLQCVHATDSTNMDSMVNLLKNGARPDNALRWFALNVYCIKIKTDCFPSGTWTHEIEIPPREDICAPLPQVDYTRPYVYSPVPEGCIPQPVICVPQQPVVSQAQTMVSQTPPLVSQQQQDVIYQQQQEAIGQSQQEVMGQTQPMVCCPDPQLSMDPHPCPPRRKPPSKKSKAKAFVRRELRNNKVVIFTKKNCCLCSKATKVFEQYIPRELSPEEFTVIDLCEREDCVYIQNYLQKLTGARTVPRVFIHGKCLGGYTETDTAHQCGRLVNLLCC